MSKVGIFVGSVYGNSHHVAEEVNSLLSSKGCDCEVFLDPDLNDFSSVSRVLFITSTTGEGEIPPNIEFFIDDLRELHTLMNYTPFAVVGLGDNSYGESYCMAGKKIFALLSELQGTAMAGLLEIDACETLEPEVEVLAWVENLASKFL